jgi:hypothetical protein
MELLVEIRIRRSKFSELIDPFDEMSKRARSKIRVRFTREYRKLEHMTLVQFPECRDTWPFEFPPSGMCLRKLRREMRKIDANLARAASASPIELSEYFGMCLGDYYHDQRRKAEAQQ